MRITNESNGKRYRAYSPNEFFKTPENPQSLFNINELKPKRSIVKPSEDKPNPKAI